MTKQHQPTKLELYAQVLSAYQQAGPWRFFFRYTCNSQWWWVILWAVLIILVAILGNIALDGGYISAFMYAIFVGFFALVPIKVTSRNFDRCFKNEKVKYQVLFEVYKAGWEFNLYLCFRAELCKFKFRTENVDQVNTLISLDQQSLGAYVAKNPLVSWIYGTSGAVIAASATNWSSKGLVRALLVSVVALVVLHFFPTLITNQRRQWELHRWLAWYKAEASKPATLTSNSISSLPD